MTFTSTQNEALAAPLSRSHVKTRSQSGRNLSYIESWVAISEANRIFGFDGWSRETVEVKCVSEREREIGQQKTPGWSVSYIGKVRVTVGDVVREGYGSGHGIDRDLGLAHESAIKECESDAAKRALMTFGNPFGLALYDKEQNGVESGAAKQVSPTPKQEAPKTIAADINDATAKARKWADDAIAAIKKMDAKALSNWEMDNGKIIVRLKEIDPDKHRQLLAAMQECDGLIPA